MLVRQEGGKDALDDALGALVERAVDGQDVELAEELLEVLDAASLDGSLGLSRERLVVVCSLSSSATFR